MSVGTTLGNWKLRRTEEKGGPDFLIVQRVGYMPVETVTVIRGEHDRCVFHASQQSEELCEVIIEFGNLGSITADQKLFFVASEIFPERLFDIIADRGGEEQKTVIQMVGIVKVGKVRVENMYEAEEIGALQMPEIIA